MISCLLLLLFLFLFICTFSLWPAMVRKWMRTSLRWCFSLSFLILSVTDIQERIPTVSLHLLLFFIMSIPLLQSFSSSGLSLNFSVFWHDFFLIRGHMKMRRRKNQRNACSNKKKGAREHGGEEEGKEGLYVLEHENIEGFTWCTASCKWIWDLCQGYPPLLLRHDW